MSVPFHTYTHTANMAKRQRTTYKPEPDLNTLSVLGENFGSKHDGCTVEFVCRDLEQRLVSLIGQHDAFVGCVAWLTNPIILNAMARKSLGVVVQKEDFLRPDTAKREGGRGFDSAVYRRKLRKQYEDAVYALYEIGNMVPAGTDSLNPFAIDGIDGRCLQEGTMAGDVRCFGKHSTFKGQIIPRMHNKFIVLGNWEWVQNIKYFFPWPCEYEKSPWLCKHEKISIVEDCFLKEERCEECGCSKENIQKIGMPPCKDHPHKLSRPGFHCRYCYITERKYRVFHDSSELSERQIACHHDFNKPNVTCKECFYHRVFVPKTVWTGSFNFSVNSTRSIENAVIITDPRVASAYHAEWSQIYLASESLDWECPDWTPPDDLSLQITNEYIGHTRTLACGRIPGNS